MALTFNESELVALANKLQAAGENMRSIEIKFGSELESTIGELKVTPDWSETVSSEYQGLTKDLHRAKDIITRGVNDGIQELDDLTEQVFKFIADMNAVEDSGKKKLDGLNTLLAKNDGNILRDTIMDQNDFLDFDALEESQHEENPEGKEGEKDSSDNDAGKDKESSASSVQDTFNQAYSEEELEKNKKDDK